MPVWIKLPDIVLIEIFQYLSDSERAKAALVCENWSTIFNSPCLWRSRTYELGGYMAQDNGIRACKYAGKFGRYLRYLAISCSHLSFQTRKLFQKSIDVFFVTLRKAETQLYDFELCRLELESYWQYNTPKEKLISIFSKFLNTQKRLQHVDMSSAQLPAHGGCRILDSIAHQSGSTIQDIVIDDFFHSGLAMHQVNQFHKVIVKFTNLHYISLSYNCLSDEILEIFSKTLQKKLHFLNVKVFHSDPRLHRISSLAWKQFSCACPCLRVAFWFESIGMHDEITPILVKGVPVKDIHIWTGYDDDMDWRLTHTIDHITDTYPKSLESVSFELDNNQDIIDQSILQLVTKCKRLKELSVNAVFSVKTFEDICEMLREKTIDLSILHVTFCGVAGQLITEEQLIFIREHYSELMHERGVDFRLYRFDY